MGGYDEESASSTDSSFGSESSEAGAEPPKGSSKVGSDGEALRPIVGNTPMELFAGAIAGASVASSAAAMIVQPINIVFAAGGLSCAIGPYAYWQQRRLTDVVALQETHKALAEQVERLGKQNERLHDTVDELSETVDKLEDVEQALEVITMQQGQSIEAFEAQVADNRDILSKMQSSLKGNVLQNLLQVVIRSDKDESMTIEDHEIGQLIDQIKGINGVEVNEPKFKEKITQSGGSLQCVMDIIRNLMNDDVSEGDEIFVIKD